MSKLFEQKWNHVKERLLEGDDLKFNKDGSVNENKTKMMETVLNNTMNDLRARTILNEQATLGSTGSGNIATLNKVILPILRRVMPTVIANEIVGVQPMTGPVGQIHTLRVKYADSIASGVTAGTEALSPFDIARYYSGNNDVNNPAAQYTGVLEGLPGNKISIEILKATVEAKTRKLSSRWTFEGVQDAQAQQGIDLEAEIMASTAQEIVTEIDQEILNSLRNLAGTASSTFDQANLSGVATFVGDEHAALAILINRQANLIASRTRRGPANWIVVSQTALTILQSATTSAFARTTIGTFDAPSNTKFVGTLNGSVRVYVDAYAADNTPVLVGLKNSEVDSAAFYCPYIPLTTSGTIIDPSTFEPVTQFMTRYGFLTLTNSANSLGNSADYVSTIGINTANLKFM